jgi:FixJ family two-component response regulator
VEPSQPSELRALINRALADKVLTRAEQEQILSAVMADQEISPEEHELLESIVERLNSGEIRAVD